MSESRRKSLVSITVFILIAGLILSYPLIAVWRQVYITTASQRLEVVADSIASLRKETLRLKMEAERLAGTRRIERIAREALGLDYPPSQNIVIMRPQPQGAAKYLGQWHLLTVLRKSFSGAKG
jgi:cell division protein FtsL